MDKRALFKIPYGLYMLSASADGKDNACIVNTAAQVANDPVRICVSVIKNNLTCDMISATGKFCVSAITPDASFELFKRFGMQSGRDVDKFADKAYEKTENGLYYISDCANAVMSAKVIDCYDYDTHTLFVAEVTEAKTLSSDKSVTYEYYQSNIKPKPAAAATAPESTETARKPKGWVCKICGYVHEEEELPPDFICPWCKHPAEDFEPIY